MGVMADVIKIVVFTSDTNASLTIDNTPIAGHRTQWIHSAKKQWLEL